MADVLITYSRQDKGFMQTLCDAILRSKHNAWVDGQAISPTTEQWSKIKVGIEEAHTFIVLSSDSIASEYSQSESSEYLEYSQKATEQVDPWVVLSNGVKVPKAAKLQGESIATGGQQSTSQRLAIVAALSGLLWLAFGMGVWGEGRARLGQFGKRAEILPIGSQNWPDDAEAFEALANEQALNTKNQAQPFIGEIQGHSSSVWSVSFSPDGQTLASASGDGVIKLWDLSGRELHTFQSHPSSVYSVSFSPDGQTLASASFDRTVKLWDLNGQELQTLQGHSALVYSVSFSPDGQMLASASGDEAVKLWDRSGRELQTLSGHSDSVYSVSFSPDGQTLASASADGVIKLWDLSGQELLALEGHSRVVHSVSFSPDGQTLASASGDRTVKWWALSGQELQTLEGHSDSVYSVSFSPDGQTLASGSRDGTVKLWDLEGAELQTLRGHSD